MNAILTLGFAAIIMSLCVIGLAVSGLRHSRSSGRLIETYRKLTVALNVEIIAKENLIDAQQRLLDEREKIIALLKGK